MSATGKPLLKPIIICDLDGTLAMMVDIGKGVRSPFDWHRVGEDVVRYSVYELVKTLDEAGYPIYIVSGRDAVCRKETEAWLKKYRVPYKKLLMRAEGDNRKDTIVKKEIYKKHIYPERVLFVLDDRNQVVKMWRDELQLPCFQVAAGEF